MQTLSPWMQAGLPFQASAAALTSALQAGLERAHGLITQGALEDGMQVLAHGLYRARERVDPAAWALLVQHEWGRRGVRALTSTVSDLIHQRQRFHDQHLVYVLGLLEQLAQPVARRLLHQLHDSLAPDGQLLVANFMPGIRNLGYMESYMNWQMILRRPAQLAELLDDLPPGSRGSLQLSRDADDQIAFALLTRMD